MSESALLFNLIFTCACCVRVLQLRGTERRGRGPAPRFFCVLLGGAVAVSLALCFLFYILLLAVCSTRRSSRSASLACSPIAFRSCSSIYIADLSCGNTSSHALYAAAAASMLRCSSSHALTSTLPFSLCPQVHGVAVASLERGRLQRWHVHLDHA